MLDQTHAALCNHIVELLCFMIRTHPSRIKYVLLGDDLLMHVNKLLSCRDNSIKLGKFHLNLALLICSRDPTLQDDCCSKGRVLQPVDNQE